MKVKVIPITALAIAMASGVLFASNQDNTKDRQAEATMRNVEAIADEEVYRNPCLMFTTCDCTFKALLANGVVDEVTVHNWIHEDDPIFNL